MVEESVLKLQAVISAMLEDSVKFEEDALAEVKGRKILAFQLDSPATRRAILNMYYLRMLSYLKEEDLDLPSYFPPSDLLFLLGYVSSPRTMRAKIVDFMEKIREMTGLNENTQGNS
jgi:hypothetical protein